MNRSPIPWLGKNGFTWNPITGCTFGCDYCYARKMASRFTSRFDKSEMARHYGSDYATKTDAVSLTEPVFSQIRTLPFAYGFRPTMHKYRLDEPVRRKQPATIFLGSMGDLFDPAFTDDFRDRIFDTVAATPQHIYTVLTKQAEAIHRYFTERMMDGTKHHQRVKWNMGGYSGSPWPLPNLILGVTVTNQEDADTRIPLLLETPSAYRMVSVEPMLGPVDLSFINTTPPLNALAGVRALMKGETQTVHVPSLDFVAIGAKTPGKPLHESPIDIGGMTLANPRTADLRTLLAQCAEARVPVNYKHGNDTPSVDGITYDCTLAELVKP